MKLIAIYLYALTNAAHYEILHSILEFALKCAGIKDNLGKWFLPFKAAVEKEGEINAISLKNVITKQLASLDRQRDGIFAALCGATNAMMKSIEAEKREAAESVMNELTSLRVNPNDDYTSQTGQIDSLVSVLLGKEVANVTLIGLLPLVQELRQVNDKMHELLVKRDMEQLGRANDGLALARKATDAAYADFVRAVEAYPFLHADELAEDDLGFKLFFDEANARIEYVRRYSLKVNGVPEEDKPETEKPEGTEKPDDKKEVTASFTFINDETVEVKAEAGAEFVAPENTEGYEWEPEVPETMPAEDTSYYEVAIPGEEEEEEEEEEERPKYRVTFRAGGSLVAIKEYHEGDTIVPPECPEGFRWPDDMPTVMPAENIVVRAEGLDD